MGNQKLQIKKTDNVVTKRQNTNGQTMIYKTLHRKNKVVMFVLSDL